MKKIIFTIALLAAGVAQATPAQAQAEKNCTMQELELARRMFENEHDANTQKVRLAQSEAMRINPNQVDQIYGVGKPDPMILAPSLAQAAAEDGKNFLQTCDVPRLFEAIQVSRQNLQYELLRISRITRDPKSAQ